MSNRKKYLGYFILGAEDRTCAEKQLGLTIWCGTRPSRLRRYLLEKLLNIYWVDRERESGRRGGALQNPDADVEFLQKPV